MAITNFIITVCTLVILHGYMSPKEQLISSLTHFKFQTFQISPPDAYVFHSTAVGVGAVAYLMKSDVRHGSAMLRRNLKHIRGWMEEQGAAAE